ncbi:MULTISPECIES: AraC family transcriptional regulator [unclassified Streptosporangium]|uniref:AraC family transcriptional regulator n=1 Tax=unclassified Streptosporangium TaxID=2632669 RepID=UPI002E2C691F|nr:MULTISPECIES: AraC family transcriptional regulator [unclassified Streptosporangium]
MSQRLWIKYQQYAYDMDVLSDALAAMRTGRPHSSRAQMRAPWRLYSEPFAGAGFHVVVQGSCRLTPPDDAPIALSVGDLVFFPHGCGHWMTDDLSTPQTDIPTASLPEPRPEHDDESSLDSDVRIDGSGASTVLMCGAYLMDRSRSHPLLSDLPEVIHLPARLGRHPSVRSAIDLLGTELEQPRPGADAVLPALLDMLLLFILRAWYEEQSGHDTATGWATALADPGITAALHSIHHTPDRQWTVEELGEQAGLSRAAFARRFATLLGRPPLTYLTWWRMTLAARHLRDSDAPIAVVAERIGYTSEFAFAKAFKREYGTAPGKYRRQCR